MILRGTVKRGTTHWLAEVPAADLMTQGGTRAEALDMMSDAIVTLVDKPGFKVKMREYGVAGGIEAESDDTQALMNLCIERLEQREIKKNV